MTLGIAANRDGAGLDGERKGGRVLVNIPIAGFVDADIFPGIDKTPRCQPRHTGDVGGNTLAARRHPHAVIHKHIDRASLRDRDIQLVSPLVLVVIGQHDVLGAEQKSRYVVVLVGPVHEDERVLRERIGRNLRILGGVRIGISMRNGCDKLSLYWKRRRDHAQEHK